LRVSDEEIYSNQNSSQSIVADKNLEQSNGAGRVEKLPFPREQPPHFTSVGRVGLKYEAKMFVIKNKKKQHLHYHNPRIDDP